jgi:zinc protease
MKVSSNVRLYSSSSELAGEISLSVMAFPDKDLDEVYDAVQVALNDFETNGISEKDLNRIKAGAESSFYRGLSSVMGKSSQLAHYNIFAGDPGFITEDISNLLEVTIQDVERVYDQYIRDKSFIATSFVPKGSAELALQGSQPAHIAEENILSSVETFDVDQVVEYEKTPSTFDRSIEPPYGESPETPVPQVWKKELANGLNIYGIENNEVPLVDLSIIVKGGMLVDHPNKVGVANLFGILMNKGTQNKTPAELEEAIEELGARISFRSGQENIRISVSCLAKNYSKTMDLLEEMMFEPRWDQTEFDLARASIKSSLEQQKGNPGSIGSNEYSKLIYGPQHIFSHNSEGSLESLEMITMQDLKDFYKNYFSQDEAILNFVGALDQETVVASLSDISNKWEAKPVSLPEYSVPKAPENSLVYLYDVPDAKQSIIYIGYPCMDVSDPDFYPASVMNYILGGGGFASRLTQVLRQEKGFTYGIRSGFSGSEIAGPFTISTSVKTSNTLEALILIQGILQDYADTFTEEDLEVTKSFLIKKNARAFETSGAKLDMLNQISTYGWSNDFIRQQEQIVRNMTVDQIRALAKKYIDPSRMLYLVVGDAKTQMDLLEELGYGKAISL